MSSFWDEFKALFKTDSQREEERRQQIKDAVSAQKSLTEQLAKLDSEYRAGLPVAEQPDLDELFPESSGLEEIEYTPATDDEIADRAQSEIDYLKTSERNKLDTDYDKAVKSLTEQSDTAKETLEDSYRKLDELYGELKQQAENDSIKRGIARSSIAASRLSDLDNAHMTSAGEAEAAYNAAVDAINVEIASLQTEQETALEELDLKYAAELQDRIAELKSERDKTVAEYEKYNNSVAEKNRELRAPRFQHHFQIIPVTLFQPMAETTASVPAIAAPKPRLIPVHPAQYRRVFSIATHSQSDELKRPAAPQRIIKADPYPRS